MALIEVIKVTTSQYKEYDSTSQYKEYDSDCTAKKHIKKMVLYHSTDLTWVPLKLYIAQ